MLTGMQKVNLDICVWEAKYQLKLESFLARNLKLEVHLKCDGDYL
jgi:hypothetical protein